MFDNEVNKLFAFLFCNSRASRIRVSCRQIASSPCLNSVFSNPCAANFYAAIAEFFPVTTDFCSLNISALIAPSAGNYGLTLIWANDDLLSMRLRLGTAQSGRRVATSESEEVRYENPIGY